MVVMKTALMRCAINWANRPNNRVDLRHLIDQLEPDLAPRAWGQGVCPLWEVCPDLASWSSGSEPKGLSDYCCQDPGIQYRSV